MHGGRNGASLVVSGPAYRADVSRFSLSLVRARVRTPNTFTPLTYKDNQITEEVGKRGRKKKERKKEIE